MEKEASFEKPKRGAHVLALTYPTQGHINPLLQFSKRLASKGLKITLLTTSNISSKLSFGTTNSLDLEFLTIFDGYREGNRADDLDLFLEHLKTYTSQSLHDLLDYYNKNQTNLHPTPKMVIYDSFMSYVLDVTTKFGIVGVPFFTQSCLLSSIYYYVYEGALTTPSNRSIVSLPSLNGMLGYDDLPSFVTFPSMLTSVRRMVLEQFSNVSEANFVLVNTVDKLEPEAVSWMANQWPVKTIGPAIPSMYLDKRLPDDRDYGLSVYIHETDMCIKWLDTKESGSVVYISMGSLASLTEKQMEEIAFALEKCNKHFLWVVRSSQESKLPQNLKEKTSEKYLIVNWCLQLEVLAHHALGCFMTHCGWNSTLEAISLGVPMVAFPQWTDQPTNAKCITDFWKVGVRVKANEEGVAIREEIESCIRVVIEGETANEFRRNAAKWKQVAIEAMEEGGSSNSNIEEFVAKLLCC